MKDKWLFINASDLRDKLTETQIRRDKGSVKINSNNYEIILLIL